MEPSVKIDHTTRPEAARMPYTDPPDTHATMLPSLDKAAENGTWYDKRTGVKKRDTQWGYTDCFTGELRRYAPWFQLDTATTVTP